MKILVYDNNHNDIEHFHGLLDNMPFDINVEKYTRYSDVEKNFKLNSHDMVFLDIESDNSPKLLKYINEQSPKQKIVVFNNSLKCSEELGCEHCRSNYNKCRIIKPVNYQDIIYALKNNHCEYDYCGTDIEAKLSVLSKPFQSLKLNIDSLQLNHSNSNNNLVISDTIDFTKLLDKNNIKFKVFENYIQVYE